MKHKLTESVTGSVVTLGTIKYMSTSLTLDDINKAVTSKVVTKNTSASPTWINKFESYLIKVNNKEAYIESGEGIKDEAINALSDLVKNDGDLNTKLNSLYLNDDNDDKKLYDDIVDFVDEYLDAAHGSAYSNITIKDIYDVLTSTELKDSSWFLMDDKDDLTNEDVKEAENLVKGTTNESTDAGATSGIHISSGQQESDENDEDNLDLLLSKDLNVNEGLFTRKFNRMIRKIYEDEQMSDYAVPQVMDINDATLTKDGTLTLGVTLQYDDNDVKDSSIVIKNFTGDSGTYNLIPSDDIADVDDGDISAKLDVDKDNDTSSDDSSDDSGTETNGTTDDDDKSKESSKKKKQPSDESLNIKLESLHYDIDIKGSKNTNNLRENFIITKIGTV